MSRSKLKPEILDALENITGVPKQRLRERIARRNPVLTSNAAAFLMAQDYGRSIARKLDEEDRAALKDYQALNRQTTTVIPKPSQRRGTNGERSRKKHIINYVSTNPSNSYFVNEHIRELTDAYYAKCYTAVFILFRKIVENLIIDILKAKFPDRIELVFSRGQQRYHDFSVVLQNLFNERNAFKHDGKKQIERLYNLVEPFRKEANDKTHSWFYIVKSSSEVDKDKELEPIIELVILLEKEVGLRTN